jgi:hypothetical protein
MRTPVVSVVIVIVAGLVGGALPDLLLQGAPALAQGGGAIHEVVVAREFRLVGTDDETRASLAVAAEGGVALSLHDTEGETRAALQLAADGTPNLSLNDAAGGARAILGLGADGSSGLRLADTEGLLRASLTVAAEGPNLAETPNLDLWSPSRAKRIRLGFARSYVHHLGLELSYCDRPVGYEWLDLGLENKVVEDMNDQGWARQPVLTLSSGGLPGGGPVWRTWGQQ